MQQESPSPRTPAPESMVPTKAIPTQLSSEGRKQGWPSFALQALMLLLSLLFVFGIAAIGSYFTTSQIDTWYTQINKPTWNPPNWVFPVVWTPLFAMMGVSLWLVWREYRRQAVGVSMVVFAIQISLNALWSYLFFGQQAIELAKYEILLLLLSIVVTIVCFWPIRRWAAVLLMPYAAWVAFASYLNWTIASLN